MHTVHPSPTNFNCLQKRERKKHDYWIKSSTHHFDSATKSNQIKTVRSSLCWNTNSNPGLNNISIQSYLHIIANSSSILTFRRHPSGGVIPYWPLQMVKIVKKFKIVKNCLDCQKLKKKILSKTVKLLKLLKIIKVVI